MPANAIRWVQSDAIRRNQMQSDAISWVKAISSNAISWVQSAGCNQTQSDAIRCNQMGEGNQLNCNQLKCNQLGAGAARAGTSCTRFDAIRGNPRQSEQARAARDSPACSRSAAAD